MKRIVLNAESIPADHISIVLEEHGISINGYSEEYFSHPRFSISHAREKIVVIGSLKEIGLEEGATLDALFRHIQGTDLKPCSPDTGLLLRLAWTDQLPSQSAVLSGTHNVPDQAVTVLSEILDQRDTFPKGLYLRNVDGRLWLRGYICDAAYRFPNNALFAFETCMI